jgi:hypothetical protein
MQHNLEAIREIHIRFFGGQRENGYEDWMEVTGITLNDLSHEGQIEVNLKQVKRNKILELFIFTYK